MEKKYRNMAYMGIVGAVLFAVGDWLIYLYPGLTLELDVQPLWAEMPAWRFVGSTWCGLLGGIVMLFGAYSAYRAIRAELGAVVGRIAVLGIPGAALAAFAHFVLGSLLPLTYKNALAAGATVEQATQLCMQWSAYMTAPDVLMIVLLYLPLLLLLYMTVRGKYGIPRKVLLVNAAFLLSIAVLQRVLGHWEWVGVLGASESLLEGCLYINLVVYWSRKTAQHAKEAKGEDLVCH